MHHGYTGPHDYFNDGDERETHLLSLSEHEAALTRAGFEGFRRVNAAGDLVLFAATLLAGFRKPQSDQFCDRIV